MIHINLLPPELRKRRTGVSPVSMSLVGGGVVCLLMGFGVLKVHWHIQSAETLLETKTAELETKKKQAAEVTKLEAVIADAKKQRDYVVGLLLQKMYWAHTIDEFAATLNGPWSMPGYDVRCLDLEIAPSVPVASAARGAPRRAAGQGTEVAYRVSWRYKLFGRELAQHGDYVQSFFNTLAASRLWNDHGFVGLPADTYRGHTPKWDASIETLIIENSLKWDRVKMVSAEKAGGK